MDTSSPRVVNVPVIETTRLRLRGHTVDDLASVQALWGNPEVTRYLGGQALTTEECWSRLLRYAGHWSLMGYGYWIVEEHATGQFVGELGFSNYKRQLDPAVEDNPEVGWVIVPEKQGMGFATEAVEAILAWGLEQFGPSSVFCLIHPANVASVRVAEKCGFTRKHAGSYKESPVVILDRALHNARTNAPATRA